jgi:hypothetical protein
MSEAKLCPEATVVVTRCYDPSRKEKMKHLFEQFEFGEYKRNKTGIVQE